MQKKINKTQKIRILLIDQSKKKFLKLNMHNALCARHAGGHLQCEKLVSAILIMSSPDEYIGVHVFKDLLEVTDSLLFTAVKKKICNSQ